jgi:hypothetical protein
MFEKCHEYYLSNINSRIPTVRIILGGTDCGGTGRGLHRLPSAVAGHDAHRVRGPRPLPGHLLLPLPRLLHVGGWGAPGRGWLYLDHRQDFGRVRIKILLSSWNFSWELLVTVERKNLLKILLKGTGFTRWIELWLTCVDWICLF